MHKQSCNTQHFLAVSTPPCRRGKYDLIDEIKRDGKANVVSNDDEIQSTLHTIDSTTNSNKHYQYQSIKPLLDAFEERTTTNDYKSSVNPPRCSFWLSKGGGIILGSNISNCIVEGPNFVILCSGFPYDFVNADENTDNNICKNDDAYKNDDEAINIQTNRANEDTCKTNTINESNGKDHDAKESGISLAQVVLNCVEKCLTSIKNTDSNVSALLDNVRDAVGTLLATVKGHFVVLVCHQETETLWVFNDPFGLMPLFRGRVCDMPYADSAGIYNNGSSFHHGTVEHHQRSDGRMVALSSNWDCLAYLPGFRPLIDPDIVAEYIVLGSTLGGHENDSAAHDHSQTNMSPSSWYRTFVRGIDNAPPGSCFQIQRNSSTSTSGLNCDQQDAQLFCQQQLDRYIKTFGACERVKDESNSLQGTNKDHKYTDGEESHDPFSNSFRSTSIKGIAIATAKLQNDEQVGKQCHTSVLPDSFFALRHAVRRSHTDSRIVGAALTGGGDTRLNLSCMDSRQRQSLVFQTHDKQRTDFEIARFMAKRLELKHKIMKIPAESGNESRRRRRNKLHLAALHDEVVSRSCERDLLRLPRLRKENKQEADYVMHGRFGTELLGFLCFHKTSVAVQFEGDVNLLEPRATRLFRAVFHASAMVGGINQLVCNPVVTLRSILQNLSNDRRTLREVLTNESHTQGSNKAERHKTISGSKEDEEELDFDVTYALQLQLFTRAFLCDIYGGLRGGSWFAMPYAFFTRNAFSPFLDSRLLRLLLCRVPPDAKIEPYQLYGRLYRRFVSPSLREVPCNNALLCRHASIPQARKHPEVSLLPYQIPEIFHRGTAAASIPKRRGNTTPKNFIKKTSLFQCCRRGRGVSRRNTSHSSFNATDTVAAISTLQSLFTPNFWGAFLALSSSSSMDGDAHGTIPKEAVGLVQEVGIEDSLLLSSRMTSFLLWYHRRFLPIVHLGL